MWKTGFPGEGASYLSPRPPRDTSTRCRVQLALCFGFPRPSVGLYLLPCGSSLFGYLVSSWCIVQGCSDNFQRCLNNFPPCAPPGLHSPEHVFGEYSVGRADRWCRAL